MKPFRSARGIYVRAASDAYLNERFASYPELLGDGPPPDLAVSASSGSGGWVLVGVPDALERADFFNLALWLAGGELPLDEDGPPAPELPPGDVIAASYADGDPAQCFYAVMVGPGEVELHGRRDDGKGLRIDVIDDTVKTQKAVPKGLTLPVLDYLRDRGVPAELLPGPDGFSFAPARLVSLADNQD